MKMLQIKKKRNLVHVLSRAEKYKINLFPTIYPPAQPTFLLPRHRIKTNNTITNNILKQLIFTGTRHSKINYIKEKKASEG